MYTIEKFASTTPIKYYDVSTLSLADKIAMWNSVDPINTVATPNNSIYKNTFYELPSGYAIFPIRIDQRELSYIYVPAGFGGNVDGPYYTIKPIYQEKTSNTLNIYKFILPTSLIGYSFNNGILTQIVGNKLLYDVVANPTYYDSVMKGNYTRYKNTLFDTITDNRTFGDYRPATQQELAWLRMNSSSGQLNSYIDSTLSNNSESATSPIQFIVGPTPTATKNLTTPWINITANVWVPEIYLKIYIVGDIILSTSFAINDTNIGSSVNDVNTFITNYAKFNDIDISFSTGNNNSLELFNAYTTYINSLPQDKSSFTNIFKKYIFYGTKTYSRGCNVSACKTKLGELQNTFTAYNVTTDIPECDGCVATDFTDISGVWNPPLFRDIGMIQNNNILTLQPRTSIPKNTNNSNNSNIYSIYIYRTTLDNTDSEDILSTLASARSDTATASFTVPAGVSVSNLTLDLNTNILTPVGLSNITIPISNSILLYDFQRPKYTIKLYKKPTYGWGNDPSGQIFTGSFALNADDYKYSLTANTGTYYTYMGIFMKSATLPAGTYLFTLTSTITTTTATPTTYTISAPVVITTTTLFNSYELNLNGAGSLTLLNGTTRGASVPINKSFASQYNGSLSVDIRKQTESGATSTYSNPIFSMNPYTLPLQDFTTIPTLSGTILQGIFANNYQLDANTSNKLSFTIGAYYENTYNPTNNTKRYYGNSSTSNPYINISGIRGFKININDENGYAGFNYIDDSGGAKTPYTTLNVPLLYPVTYNGTRILSLDIKINDNTSIVPVSVTIPSTTLTINTNAGTTGTGVGGAFELGADKVTVPPGTYTINVRSFTDEVGTQNVVNHSGTSNTISLTGLSSYMIDTAAEKILFFKKDNTKIGELLLTNNFNTTLSTTQRSIDVSIGKSDIGTFKTRSIRLGGVYITGAPVAIDANGYRIRGEFKQGSTNVALTPNLNYTIGFKHDTTPLFELSSNQLGGAKAYELNVSKNTLTFYTDSSYASQSQVGASYDLTVNNSNGTTSKFIQYLYNNVTKLDIVLNGTIKLQSLIDIPTPKFTIKQTDDVFTYTLPVEHTLIPSLGYKLLITSSISGSSTRERKTYGTVTFNPKANTNSFTLNINTGLITFANSAGTFDIQGLRDAEDKTVTVTLYIHDVPVPLQPFSTTNIVSVEKTNVTPQLISTSSTTDADVLFKFGETRVSASTASSAEIITPITRLEPNTSYSVIVRRVKPITQIIGTSMFTTLNDTSTISGIAYNRDENKIDFVDTSNQLLNTPADVILQDKTVDTRRINNEEITLQILQRVNYATISGSTTYTASASPIATKTIASTSANPINLGEQKVNAVWRAGYILFSFSAGRKSIAKLPAGVYKFTISGAQEIDLTSTKDSEIQYIRVNPFTGYMYINELPDPLKTADRKVFDTGVRLGLTERTITATIQIASASGSGGASIVSYTAGTPLTLNPHIMSIPTELPTTTNEVSLLVKSNDGGGYTYEEAKIITLPQSLSYATLNDVKNAAAMGANWYTPGWILGSDLPPVYPVNKDSYAKIQRYVMPNFANLPEAERKPVDPDNPANYVISHSPADGRAGILVKGPKDAPLPEGTTRISFNTYTGKQYSDSPEPINEPYYIKFPTPITFEEARDICRDKPYYGDIALDTDVGTAGKAVPNNAHWKTPGLMYKTFTSKDASNNMVVVGFPVPPVKGDADGLETTEFPSTDGGRTFTGVVCWGDKSRAKVNQERYENGKVVGVVSDYNTMKNIWSKYDGENVPYQSYTVKNLDAIINESDPYLKAAMIINDARTEQNIVFARNKDDADKYVGCDVNRFVCIAKDPKDPAIEDSYTVPTSSTGKWVDLDIESGDTSKPEGFVNPPLPAGGMQRMFMDMEIFNRTPAPTRLLGDGAGGNEGFIGATEEIKEEQREAIRSAMNDILACQEAGGAVNLGGDASVYPGCTTLCCYPDDGRVLDPSLIRNRRKTTGPGAAGCDDESGCTEADSKPVIRHTPAPAAFRLKKKTGAPAGPEPTCTSATPIRTLIANKKRDKLQSLRETPK